MKGGFYAVYGYNRACIYDDWHKVQVERDKFIGHKVKSSLNFLKSRFVTDLGGFF